MPGRDRYRAGYDFLVLDQTRPDVEVPVARVLVPGLRHFYSPLSHRAGFTMSGEAWLWIARAGKRNSLRSCQHTLKG